jgi:CRP-like cAMP-binding protein
MHLSFKSWRNDFGEGGPYDFGRWTIGTRSVPARRTFHREGEQASEFALIEEGWAFRFRVLPDGRRQIFWIALPGDPVALESLWTDRLSVSVQSLTELKLRLVDRQAIVQHMRADPALAFRLGEALAGELAVLESRLVTLGQRTALERVASLILLLHARLKQRGLADRDSFPFPLRQRHIADILGMTPVHVSRVFTELRAGQLIARTGETLAILDYARLVEAAGL